VRQWARKFGQQFARSVGAFLEWAINGS